MHLEYPGNFVIKPVSRCSSGVRRHWQFLLVHNYLHVYTLTDCIFQVSTEKWIQYQLLFCSAPHISAYCFICYWVLFSAFHLVFKSLWFLPCKLEMVFVKQCVVLCWNSDFDLECLFFWMSLITVRLFMLTQLINNQLKSALLFFLPQSFRSSSEAGAGHSWIQPGAPGRSWSTLTFI